MGREANDNQELTMDEALARYWEANDFGPDGGYSKAWDWFKLGPLKFPIPNPPARKRALAYHDMHHVVTGYTTDWRGEFEIAGWELARGCGRVWIGWALNLAGFALGMLLMPYKTIAAFMRGRRATNLYKEEPAQLSGRWKQMTVAQLRAHLGVDRGADRPGGPPPEDWRALAKTTALAFTWLFAQLALLTALLVLPLCALAL